MVGTDEDEGFDWTEDEYINRPRGILSPKERAHLYGMLDEDPTDDTDAATIRAREHRIRKHVRHSLIDFYTLSKMWGMGNSQNMQKVFKDINEANEETGTSAYDTDPLLAQGIESMFELLHLMLTTPQDPLSIFDTLFSRGVKSALVRHFAMKNISVDPSVWIDTGLGVEVPLNEIHARYMDGDNLLRDELDALFWAGKISYEERNERKTSANELGDQGFLDFLHRRNRDREQFGEVDRTVRAKVEKMNHPERYDYSEDTAEESEE